MVDLDQCTHATINGCDKEQQGWYPLPSSLSPSICLPSCPSRCPLPNCFSLTIAHLHLHWHPPGHRPCVGVGVPLMAGVPDVLSAASIRLPRPVPWENSELSFYQTYHEITVSSPPPLTHCNFSHSFFLSCSGSGCISHVILPRLYSLSSAMQRDFCFWPSALLLNAPFTMYMSSSDDAISCSFLHPPPRDFCMEYFHLNVHNYFGFVSPAVAMFGGGSNGTLRRLRWIKMGQRRNYEEKVEQRSDWVNPHQERWVEVGQGARC